MGGGYLGNFMTVVIDLVLGLYLFCVILRFLFQYFRADFYNPLSQAVVALTGPPLKLLRRFIPSIGNIDMASLVLALLVGIVKIYLLYLINGRVPAFPGTIIMAVGEVVRAIAYVFMFAIFIRIILSWLNQAHGNNPIISVLYTITEPLMAPARRILPPMGGLDLSPILVFIVIYFVLLVVAQPISDFGARMI